jgi:hypothetical protein
MESASKQKIVTVQAQGQTNEKQEIRRTEQFLMDNNYYFRKLSIPA